MPPDASSRRFLSWRWQLAKARQKGILRWLASAGVTALYFVPSLVLSLLRVRLVVLSPLDRIGHLALDTDCYLKEGRLGLRPRFLGLLTAHPSETIANRRLLDYWRPHLFVASSRALRVLLFPLTRFDWMRHDVAGYQAAFHATARAAGIQAAWTGRPPLLSLTEDDVRRGREVLKKLGLPDGAWFVCLHARESGFAPQDDARHDYRNCSIERYLPAAEAIAARGGWCIRMGEATTQPLPPLARVVDYAHSPFKSDEMDVFLAASGRFFLGNTSGLHFVSGVFGVPSAEANLTPLSAAFPLLPGCLGIPKLVRSVRENRVLSFQEVLSSPAGDFRDSASYAAAGLRLEENSAEDIRGLALEMLDRREGRAVYTTEDEDRQRAFRSLLKPGHYSYGAGSRIGRDFLRKHAALLGERSRETAAA